MRSYDGDPESFVQENRETFVRLLKHCDDKLVRGLALSALIEYGTDPLIEDVERDLRELSGGSGGLD